MFFSSLNAESDYRRYTSFDFEIVRQDIDANTFVITNTFAFGANKFLTKITKLIEIPMSSHMHFCGRCPHPVVSG